MLDGIILVRSGMKCDIINCIGCSAGRTADQKVILPHTTSVPRRDGAFFCEHLLFFRPRQSDGRLPVRPAPKTGDFCFLLP
jgi:hypothetical protein